MADRGIIVRLRADVSDYVNKLSAAREQFNQRMAVIRAGHAEELKLARAAVREKEALAAKGARVDIAAARQAYQERVKFAGAAAAAEIKEARRTMAARSQASTSAVEATSRFGALMAQFKMSEGTIGRSNGGLGRLNDALITLTRTSTGVPPVVGKLTDVLGSFMIGVGPMIPILAGIAAIAAGFAWITREARATKKAAMEAAEEVAKAFASRQTAGDIDAITNQGAIGKQLDRASADLKQAKEDQDKHLQGAAARVKKYTDQVTNFQTQYNQATILLDDRRAERQKSAAEKAADANKKAASDAATAWKQAVNDIEEQVRLKAQILSQYSEMVKGPTLRKNSFEVFNKTGDVMRQPTPLEKARDLGFSLPDPAASTSLRDALANNTAAVDKAAKAWGKVLIGPDGNVLNKEPGEGFFSGAIGNIKGMLDHKAILNNALGGLASGGLNFAINGAISGLSNLGKGLLGFSNTAERVTNQIIRDTKAWLLQLNGSDMEKAFAAFRDKILAQVDAFVAAMPGGARERQERARQLAPLREAKTFAEFQSALQALGPLFAQSANGLEIWNNLLKISEAEWKAANEQVREFSDALRNMPSGWKVNLATFNASQPTTVGGAATAAARVPVVRIVAEPAGIFRVVEDQAVRKVRSGGVPAWEVGRG